MTIAGRRQSTHVEIPWPILYVCVYQVYVCDESEELACILAGPCHGPTFIV